MLSKIKALLEENKFSFLNKMHALLVECEKNLQSDPIVQIIKRHHNLMLNNKFDWIHESETENLNFNDLKSFLQDFLSIFNKDITKEFHLCKIFKHTFPFDCIFLYFKNINMSFGNKVYDESLRFKTNLLRCFKDLCLEADFIFNCRIKFDNGFDFDAQTRNAFRANNRKEICQLYETHVFSLKAFIFFLMDNYYPRVGWRWIGASHFVYFLALELIVVLFEFGFWTVNDQEALFLKLYEISEVMVSLEKNSSKDSERLAETFNTELINGFSNAREQITLSIIHSYQLLTDNNVDKVYLQNLKFYYNLIITRYIFNSTKIRKSNLRKPNNLKQILYYLNSSNFEIHFDPIIEKDSHVFLVNTEIVLELDAIFAQLSNLIIVADPIENKEAIFLKFYEILQFIFDGLKQKSINFQTFVQSKVLKQFMPIINLLKDQYKDESEDIIDFCLTLFHRACLSFEGLLTSQYLKSVIKDFFGVEPFKNLHIISRLIVVGNVEISKYFFQYLGSIFISVIKEIMHIFSKDEAEITTNHEIFVSIMELFIQYFSQINHKEVDFEFIELKILIMNSIHNHFLIRLEEILVDEKMISFDQSIMLKSYEELLKETHQTNERIIKVRTKEAYLLLKLYSQCGNSSYKCSQFLFEWKNIEKIIPFIIPGHPLSAVIVNFINDTFFLSANSLINDRLKTNKSKQFILMENSFPVTEKDLKVLFLIFIKIFEVNSEEILGNQSYKDFVFEVSFPFFYKFITAFLYLNDEPKVSHIESHLEKIFRLVLFHLKFYLKDSRSTDELYIAISQKEFQQGSHLYKKLQQNDSTYTNYAKLKKQMINLIFKIEKAYQDCPISAPILKQYQRSYFQDLRQPNKFNENLGDIITKIDYISSIDSKESMTNMLTYFIEEFQKCNTEIPVFLFSGKSLGYVFLKEEYKDLICMLTSTFELNQDFKRTFIDIIEDEKEINEASRFFSKFWSFYRDSLFFSAYNFFHCKLWFKISNMFIDLNDFLLTITKTSPNSTNKILQYITDFKLVTPYHNNHTLFFQLYVVLECLGNYSKLLTLQNCILIEHKDCVLFVIENVLRSLSNILVLSIAQEKIYIYRIDIWMNLVLSNVDCLNESFYKLKNEMMNYFLAICSRDNSTIVKFYGANVNPEIMKSSINKLFKLLLQKKGFLNKVIDFSFMVHSALEHDQIYQVVLKIYKFYTILVRHDVQTNYLNLFMFQKIDNLETCNKNIDYLLSNNLLFFYYANQIFTKLPFKINENNFCIKEILVDQNKIKIFPPFVNMIKEGKIKLWDYLVNLKNEPVSNIKVINDRLSVVLQLIKSVGLRTNEEILVLKKIQDNDLEWIEKYLLADF